MKKIIKLILKFLFGKILLKINLKNLEKKEKNILLNEKLIINGRKAASTNINDYEFSAFSQWGEDGILNHLINNLNIKSKSFIEFGVENYLESNTRFILQNNNWSGLILDNDEKNIREIQSHYYYWKHDLKAKYAHITAENINQIIQENTSEKNLGILSIDVDGNDYWIWKNINVVDAQIVVIEYNSRFGKDKSVTIPYDPNFERKKSHPSMIYYGASLKALCKLAELKNLKLVGTNIAGNNAFFVKENLLNDQIQETTIEKCFRYGKFRESRDEKGELSFKSINEEIEILKKLELVEV